jgi:hypothetical protein
MHDIPPATSVYSSRFLRDVGASIHVYVYDMHACICMHFFDKEGHQSVRAHVGCGACVHRNLGCIEAQARA